MFDLGRSFFASIERTPNRVAIVDGNIRLSYRVWFQYILLILEEFENVGIRKGDRVLVILKNGLNMASIYWACQIYGAVFVPVNWRSTSEELGFFIFNAEAKLVITEDEIYHELVVSGIPAACILRNVTFLNSGGYSNLDCEQFHFLPNMEPAANVEDLSVIFYTSGTTSRPKGVPRKHQSERAASIAHAAQNKFEDGEITLGIMPLFHTMGLRLLISTSLVGGIFVCMRQANIADALCLIDAENVRNLCMVPTLYHDLLYHPNFKSSNLSSVRNIMFAGAPMSPKLAKELKESLKPELL